MKKIATALVLAVCLTTSSCAAVSQWWQSFSANPVQQTQTFIQEVQTILSTLTTIWSFVQPFIPASQLNTANSKFTTAVTKVNKASSDLSAALTDAAAAKTSSPNLTPQQQAVGDAIDGVIAIIDQYKGNAPVSIPDAGPTVVASDSLVGLEEVRARSAKLKAYKIQVQ